MALTRGLVSSRKILLAAVMVVCLTVGTATGVAAFEPPSDPADKFTCDPNPVSGHPGSPGLEGVVFSEKSLGAWNAVFAPGGTPVTLCGD
jgi:hypothetical protein